MDKLYLRPISISIPRLKPVDPQVAAKDGLRGLNRSQLLKRVDAFKYYYRPTRGEPVQLLKPRVYDHYLRNIRSYRGRENVGFGCVYDPVDGTFSTVLHPLEVTSPGIQVYHSDQTHITMQAGKWFEGFLPQNNILSALSLIYPEQKVDEIENGPAMHVCPDGKFIFFFRGTNKISRIELEDTLRLFALFNDNRNVRLEFEDLSAE